MHQKKKKKGKGKGKGKSRLPCTAVMFGWRMVEAGGELRELLGQWTVVLLIFPLFLLFFLLFFSSTF
jgi:hypothetical protein